MTRLGIGIMLAAPPKNSDPGSGTSTPFEGNGLAIDWSWGAKALLSAAIDGVCIGFSQTVQQMLIRQLWFLVVT